MNAPKRVHQRLPPPNTTCWREGAKAQRHPAYNRLAYRARASSLDPCKVVVFPFFNTNISLSEPYFWSLAPKSKDIYLVEYIHTYVNYEKKNLKSFRPILFLSPILKWLIYLCCLVNHHDCLPTRLGVWARWQRRLNINQKITRRQQPLPTAYLPRQISEKASKVSRAGFLYWLYWYILVHY